MTTAPLDLQGLNFNLSEEHRAVQEAARDFAQTELLSGIVERDNEARFPAEQVKRMSELGSTLR